MNNPEIPLVIDERIAALEAENERLRTALRPLQVAVYEMESDGRLYGCTPGSLQIGHYLSFKQLNESAQALEPTP